MSYAFHDADYTSRCSEKTLQTNDEGFFLSFADNLAEIAGKDWIEKKFGKLKSDRARIKILYDYEPVKKALIEVLSNVRELYRSKSSEKSFACRKEAERSLNENNPLKSLSLFSQSVLQAEKTGENKNVDNGNSLSLGLYGRSRVLMEMEKYDFAQNDIRLALKENLPDNVKGEAYFRLAVCYKATRDDKKADVAFNLAQKLMKEDKGRLLARYRNELRGTIYDKEEEENKVIPTQNEFTVGELLLFNLQMLQFNAHEIYEKVHPANHRFKGSKINYIGVGIYPTVALFNHQCYPSVTRYFVGKNIVVNAIKSMDQDEIVAENYGPIFTKKPLQFRQKSLISRYWFKCECLACTQNWPMLNDLSEESPIRLRCPKEQCKQIFTLPIQNDIVKCAKCESEINLRDRINTIKWCEDQYYLALEKMDAMEPNEGVRILNEALNSFHRISIPPHKATHVAEETLRACYADLGNTFKSPTQIKL
ncbi:hypothetical protein HHI36_014000 [Cryptolaemus montrouzieri]|uniref:SET domain-containing protein n=1 Tax=Cryptolaemus montrouzieri TaxID=559131 RepID=A0ABD2N2H5_9CUCU